jgi:hypothetical protein
MLNIVPFNTGHRNFVVIAELLLPSLFLNYEHFMGCCANQVMDMQVLYLTLQINQPTRCNNFSSLEIATAVVDLLMMGMRLPKTC